MAEEIVVNCENLNESINSLCNIYGVNKELLMHELKIADPDKIYNNAKSQEEFHFYITNKFRSTPKKIDKICWFHFSKSLDIHSYKKKGIIPTNKILPKLMNDCYKILDNKVKIKCKKRKIKWTRKIWNKNQWCEIWNDAIKNLPPQDKIKFEIKDFGPNGMLIKDVGLYPNVSRVGHFLEEPEIIGGILRYIDKKYKTNLINNFRKMGTPCVITFTSKCSMNIENITTPILFYVHHKLNCSKIICGSMNYTENNTVIHKKRILKVESISFIPSGNQKLTTIYNNHKPH